MPLDDPNLVELQNPASMNATVIRYGLIGGLMFIIVALIGNLTGFSSPSNMMSIFFNMVVGIILFVGLMVVTIRHHRDKDLGGYITFGRAFLVGLLVVLIAGTLSNLFNYFYITVIDPEYMTNMMRDMQGMYENFGMSEEQIEAAMAQVENLTPARIMLQGLIGQLVMGSVVAAIVAAIMKRKPE